MAHYSHDDVRIYVERLFPADLVFALFTPLPPPTAFDELVAASQNSTKTALQAPCRRWTFGGFNNLRICTSASDLRRNYLEAEDGRYDVGPIYHGPVDDLLQTGVAARHLTIDIDVTDYAFFRDKICGCGSGGESKGKMCRLCIGLVRAVAQSVTAVLQQVADAQHFAYFYTGGRGMHIYCLDYSLQFLTQTARLEELNSVIRQAAGDPTFARACQPFVAFISAYPQLPANERNLLIDEGVLIQPGKLNRAPFSVNSATGRLCFPLTSPSDFQDVECSPKVSQLIRAAPTSNVRKLFAAGLTRMERFVTVE